jgi:Berberine and berberine like
MILSRPPVTFSRPGSIGQAVEPFATGEFYVNHLDAEEATRIRAAYSGNCERLVALKNKYDPSNLFRMNQNIRPTV